MPIKKVLIVDDSPTERYFLTELLTKNGFHVSAAENADEALVKLQAAEPDLILMDVVMLSSKDGLFDRARGRMVGSSEYLTKPFTKDSLLNAVLEHSATSAALN